MGVLLLGLLIILFVANWLMADASTRIDLTKRGRYSISPQTLNLLKGLDDKITITMLFAEQDPSLNSDEQATVKFQRSQVEDVLRELRSRSDKIEVVRIDPTDPRTISKFEDLTNRIKDIYKDQTAEYEKAVQDGRDTLDALGKYATDEADQMATTIASLPPSHVSLPDFQEVIRIFRNMPRQVESWDESIKDSLDADVMRGRPFPDLPQAISIVRGGAQLQSATLKQISDYLQKLIDSGSVPEGVATRLGDTVKRCIDMQTKLTNVSDRISDLKPLELTAIDSALRSRRCVLLTNSQGAAVLPYNRLFPPPGAQQAADEGTGGVRRFAGETVLASGIRQLTMPDKPNVIFCHAEQAPSILTGRTQVDLSSVASQLRDLGFEVQEWNVNNGPRPLVEQKLGKPVWVIVPPAPAGPTSMAGVQLADAAKSLVDEGANIMIGFFPSMVPTLGQSDPWNSAIAPLGVSADTSRIVIQQVPGPNGQMQYSATQNFVNYLSDNPIAAAVQGEPTQLDYVVPLQIDTSSNTNDQPAAADKSADDKSSEATDDKSEKKAAEPADNVRTTVLLEVKPSERVWATDQWQRPASLTPPANLDTQPYPVVVASERNDQRALIVGSASWCWTGVVGQYDLSMQLPVYPGNAELFCSGVCWLAHLDELIARSPRAESVARIEDLSHGGQLFWRWALIGGLPALSLIAGIVVTVSRRG